MSETFVARLRRTGEGKVLLAGMVMLMAVSVEILILILIDGPMGRSVLSGMVVEVFAGREAGIPVALASGAPWLLVAQISFTQDIGGAAIGYSIVLHLLHRFHDRDNRFMRRIRRIEESAERRERFISRWGRPGLFLFMLAPFLVNGPLVGAIGGRLAGIRTETLLAPVLLSTAVVSIAWSYAFDALFQWTGKIDARIPYLITGLVIAVVLTLVVIVERKDSASA